MFSADVSVQIFLIECGLLFCHSTQIVVLSFNQDIPFYDLPICQNFLLRFLLSSSQQDLVQENIVDKWPSEYSKQSSYMAEMYNVAVTNCCF